MAKTHNHCEWYNHVFLYSAHHGTKLMVITTQQKFIKVRGVYSEQLLLTKTPKVEILAYQ